MFDSSVVTWPNGVTVDFSDNRIFWTDANQDYIASSGFDGEDMKYIIRGKRLAPHPFAVVVYKVSLWFLTIKADSFSLMKMSTKKLLS